MNNMLAPQRSKHSLQSIEEFGVTIVMPVYNEVGTINQTLDSLFKDECYPREKLELIFVDGMSTDGTSKLLEEYIRASDLDCRIINNRKKSTPVSLNIGIRASKHKIIIRADAHACYGKNYIYYSVDSLLKKCGDNIGGKLKAIPNSSRFSNDLAIIVNSILGSGGAGYRTLISSKEVDDTRIKASLVVRDSLIDMTQQYFGYGIGRARSMLRYPRHIRLRQVIPLCGLFVFTWCCVFAPFLIVVGLAIAVPLVYFLRTRIFYAKGISLIDCSRLFAISIVMNLSWSLGALLGLCRIRDMFCALKNLVIWVLTEDEK